MRIKVTVSLHDHELEQIDRRANELGMTRSTYLRSLAMRDLMCKRDGRKRRATDYC
jgi:metal-responsive CopG/Arc/MetJ family transcriptional regulator